MPSEPLRSFNSPCSLIPCSGREILLLQLELRGQIEQAELFLFFRDHFVEEGQVVAEEQDAGGIVDLGVLAHVALEENGRHGRDVFVAEAQVGAGEAGVAGLYGACNS